MRNLTLAGIAVAGAVALLGSGVALAARSKVVESPVSRPPYFKYVVKEGDTLTGLGLRFFGDAKQWRAISRDDSDKPLRDDETLAAGVVLRVPCLWHVVHEGDDLSKIARRYLRNPARWRRVYEANRETVTNKDKLRVGQVLAIPLSAATSHVKDGQLVDESSAPLSETDFVGCGFDLLGAVDEAIRSRREVR